MATLGLVSVICDGHVVMKLIAGCNGVNAAQVADAIRLAGERPRSGEAGLALCAAHHFGCHDCCVIVTADDLVWGPQDDEPSLDFTRFRDTFADPTFNPQWAHGTAEYTEVVAFHSDAAFSHG